MITTGHPAIPTIWTSIDEELKKVLLSALLSGVSYILFDNVDGDFRGGTIAAMLTSGFLSSRILGESRMAVVPCDATIIINGNNLQVTPELDRRRIRINLDANCERPYERSGFKHVDLESFVKENRARLIAAGLTMVRAWFANECDISDVKILGSFESWSKTVGGILKACHVDGFLESRGESSNTTDSETESWAAFTAKWEETHGGYPTLVRDLLPLAQACGLSDERRPDGFQSRSLGKALARRQDVIFGGLKITRGNISHGNQTWKIAKIYSEGGVTGV